MVLVLAVTEAWAGGAVLASAVLLEAPVAIAVRAVLSVRAPIIDTSVSGKAVGFEYELDIADLLHEAVDPLSGSAFSVRPGMTRSQRVFHADRPTRRQSNTSSSSSTVSLPSW